MSVREEALAELRDLLQPDVDPTLTAPEVDALLDKTYTPTWQPATSYRPGQRVLPAVSTGLVYRAERGGTSGATAPTFPVELGRRVTDNGVVWVAVDMDTFTPYNVRLAAKRGWHMKAGKATERHNYSADGRSMSEGEVRRACLEQAKLFDRPSVG